MPPNAQPNPLLAHLRREIAAQGGWIGFDRFMAAALYTPGLGYYANDTRKFGALPGSGSDFVTAPELSPLFGQALAEQRAQALRKALVETGIAGTRLTISAAAAKAARVELVARPSGD